MALRMTIRCNNCEGLKVESVAANKPRPDLCFDCRMLKARLDRIEWLDDLKELSIEQRLEKIEEWIYDSHPAINAFDKLY